jgi:hypothetical protein
MQDAGTVLEVLREQRGPVTREPSALKGACWVRREAARKRPGFRILEPGTSPRSPPCHRLSRFRTGDPLLVRYWPVRRIALNTFSKSARLSTP